MKLEAHRLVPSARGVRRAERFVGHFRRVGLRGVLADTNRRAARADVPAEAAAWGMTWAPRDAKSSRWYPQGITTSADAYGPDGRPGAIDDTSVLIVTWYARTLVGRLLLGSRISIIDVADDGPSPYRHVLLVSPRRVFGLNVLLPVTTHAGGIGWYGKHLYVAGTRKGVHVFRVDDIVRVRNRFRTKGYRYVLPQYMMYSSESSKSARPMRYSFLSVERAADGDGLVAGEYGRKGGSHRLIRFGLDRETELLDSDEYESVTPSDLFDKQVERMQGAAVVDGVWAISASRGEGRPGDLWVGQPGNFVCREAVLPTGPEDVTYWPQRRQLWSLTEWPGSRWVFAIDVDKWVHGFPPDE